MSDSQPNLFETRTPKTTPKSSPSIESQRYLTAAQHPGYKLCAVEWCARPADLNEVLLCRMCLIRVYEAAPEIVEALYDARTHVERRAVRKLLDKFLRTFQPGTPAPLSEKDRNLADALTRSQTAFDSFEELLTVQNGTPDGYRPCLYVTRHRHLDTPDATHRHRNLCLANLYDRAQIARNDPRRSVRS